MGSEVARLPDPLRLQERLDERPIPQGGGREGAGLSRHQARVVQGAAQDEPGDGVDVRRGDLASEPHGLQGDGAAPREGVEDLGRAPAERRANLLPEAGQIGGELASPMEDPAGRLLLLAPPGRLPGDAPADPKQQLPAAVAPGIVEQGRQQHRPARGEGPPRRPDVQGGDVAVAHVLLVHRVDGRLLQRKRRFDQAAAVTAVTHRDTLGSAPDGGGPAAGGARHRPHPPTPLPPGVVFPHRADPADAGHSPGMLPEQWRCAIRAPSRRKGSPVPRRPARRQWPPHRPDVQRRDVPVSHVLFVDGVEGDLFQRERGFDEALVSHHPAFGHTRSAQLDTGETKHRLVENSHRLVKNLTENGTRDDVLDPERY